MRTRVMTAASLCVLLLAACGGGEADQTPQTDEPTTQSPVAGPVSPGQTYTGGTASVEVTGDRTESFEAELDTEAENGFGDDEDFELEFVAGNGWVIRFDFTPAGVGPAEEDWLAIGMPGTSIDDPEYYFDGFETQCDTTLTQYDSTGVAGTFTCEDLPNAEETKTVDAEGSFEVTAAA